jgi:hypothetical protein
VQLNGEQHHAGGVDAELEGSAMRRLLPFLLFLFCAVPAHATIANAGSCSAATTSCTLSATATGDLNVFACFRASTTACTLPTGNISIATITGTTSSVRIWCRLASSSSDTGSGTATNAAAVAGASYSGINAPSNLSNACAGMGVGPGITNHGTTSTVTVSALTGGNALINSNDWVGAFIGNSAGATCSTPPTGLTSRSATGDIQVLDTNGTSAWSSSQTCTSSTGDWISVAFGIEAPPQTGSSGPQFKRGYFFPGCSSGFANCSTAAPLLVMDGTMSCPSAPCPRYAGANDMVLIAATYPSATTLTINDSTGGSNTWTVDATTTDGNSFVHALIRSCLSATTTSITPTLGTAEGTWQYEVAVFYDTTCGTSSPVDGTPICAHGITPTTNFGHAINAGSVTTTVANDLVLQFGWDENDIGIGNQAFAFGFGDNQIGLATDWISSSSGGSGGGGYAGQYFIQGTAGAVELGMTFVQNTHDSFSSCEVAYKSGTGGVTPSSHIALVRSQGQYGNGAVTTYFQFPSIPGNMLVIGNDSGDEGWSMFGGSPGTTVATDNNSSTFTAIADTVGPTVDPQIQYSCNPTLSPNETIHLTAGPNNGQDIITFEEFTNATATSATSCLDTGATIGTGTVSPTAGGNSLSATNSGACLTWTTTNATTFTGYPICVPGSGNDDLFVDESSMGTGPVTGNTTEQFDLMWGTGVGDNSSATNGNGLSHTFSTSSVSSNWTASGTSGLFSLEALFKENAALSNGLPQLFIVTPTEEFDPR